MTKYTILMIQEQYWSKYTKSAPTHHAWTLHEPNATEEQALRVAIYTNNKHLSPARVARIPLYTLDTTAIEIQSSNQNEEPTLIVNVYNPSDNNGTVSIHEQLTKGNTIREYEAIIIGGDFNRHHPLWNPINYQQHDESASEIIDLAADLNLENGN
jgi:hypothetical protein